MEYGFLSEDKNSVRKIRNMFAHANLMGINLINIENGRKIYYPLSEQESCLLLYQKISEVVFNIILKIIAIDVNIDEDIKRVDVNLVELSAIDTLNLMGWNKSDIQKIQELVSDGLVSEESLARIVDNTGPLNVYEMIFSNLL
ncbi:MAG: hypothetical protein ACERKV_01085 [Clostridiaceae bacterium]